MEGELDLERKLAAAKGEAYANTFDFPVRWDVGAPMPHVFANEYGVFLTFLVANSPMTPTEPVSLTYVLWQKGVYRLDHWAINDESG